VRTQEERKAQQNKDLWKAGGLIVGGTVLIYVGFIITNILGWNEPLKLTQAHYWLALISFYIIMYRFDTLNRKIDELKDTVDNIESLKK
jgi:hypothetical protein